LIVVAAIFVLSACHSARRVQDLDALAGAKMSRVWVTRADDSVVAMDGAQVFRGRLVGFVGGKYREFRPGEVQYVTVRQLARGKTLALIGVSAVSFTVAAVLLAGSGDHFDPCVGSAVDCRELMQ
jgi:hypothetical protein